MHGLVITCRVLDCVLLKASMVQTHVAVHCIPALWIRRALTMGIVRLKYRKPDRGL